jgi:hypothetical protein
MINMNAKVILIIWVAVQAMCTQLLAQNIVEKEKIHNPKQYVDEKGLKIPGLERADRLKLIEKREELIDDVLVQISTMLPEPRDPKEAHPGTIMPYLEMSDGKTVYREKEVLATRITRYDIGGRVFCYVVSAVNYFYDGSTKISAVAGVEYRYAFYDESGQGLFQTRETVNPSSRDADRWRLRIPTWAKNASRGHQ